MNRIISMTAVVVLAATGLASTSVAAPSKATHNGKTLTLHLVEKEVGFNYIDNPPRQGFNSPPLMGDQFVFSAELQTKSGARAGQFGATCFFTSGGNNGLLLCHGLYSLKGGQIFGMAKATNSKTTQIAIVGGTGAYAGVTGTATEVSRGDNSPYTDVTVRLSYP